MTAKLFASLALLATACVTAGAAAPEACQPVRVAEGTACVKEQLEPLRKAQTYKETTTVADNEDGTKTVTFVFEPKCLRAPTPCRIASRSVSAVVDCAAGAAVCPQ
jgi:hypothetical protein